MLQESVGRGKNPKWRDNICLCGCGEIPYPGSRWVAGHNGEFSVPRTYAKDEIYIRRLWTRIKQRCKNPKYTDYPNYGGRGISVHPDWENSGRVFVDWILNNIGHRPSPHHSLDRINNDGNYEPGNVRWATTSEQNKNKRETSALYNLCRRSYDDDKARSAIKILGILHGGN